MSGSPETEDPPGRPRRTRAEILPGVVLDGLIVELLGLTEVPLGAYPIADLLRERGRSGHIMAIYRSLDRLCKRGVIERVESLSAYRLHTTSEAVLLACTRCGTTTTLPVPSEFDAIVAAVRGTGFALGKLALEAVGVCGFCQSS